MYELLLTYCYSTKNLRNYAGQGKNPKWRVSSYFHIMDDGLGKGYWVRHRGSKNKKLTTLESLFDLIML